MKITRDQLHALERRGFAKKWPSFVVCERETTRQFVESWVAGSTGAYAAIREAPCRALVDGDPVQLWVAVLPDDPELLAGLRSNPLATVFANVPIFGRAVLLIGDARFEKNEGEDDEQQAAKEEGPPAD